MGSGDHHAVDVPLAAMLFESVASPASGRDPWVSCRQRHRVRADRERRADHERASHRAHDNARVA
jgi:hypothetical protein